PLAALQEGLALLCGHLDALGQLAPQDAVLGLELLDAGIRTSSRTTAMWSLCSRYRSITSRPLLANQTSEPSCSRPSCTMTRSRCSLSATSTPNLSRCGRAAGSPSAAGCCWADALMRLRCGLRMLHAARWCQRGRATSRLLQT